MQEKIILGISGNIGAGKETVTRYIEEKYNAGAYISSDVLKSVLKDLHLPFERKNFAILSQALRGAFGEDILSQALYHEVKGLPNKIVLADGLRREGEIQYLRQFAEFKLFFIDADMQTRYERLIKRNQKTDDTTKTFLEFENDHKREAESHTEHLKEYADYTIDNSGNLEDLYSQIDQVMEELVQ